MNTEYMDYCFKSIKRRKKNIIKTSFTIFIVFAAVTLLILIRTNVYQWQLQSVKDRFGSWFVMMCGSDGKENSELKGHPYLKESGKAVKVNNVYDNGGEMTETGIGYMTEEFIRLGNISTEEGHFPQKDDEAAVDWNTLLELNQGSSLGQDIVIRTVISDENGQTEDITRTYKLAGILKSYTNSWAGGDRVPGVIVTEQAAKDIKRNNNAIYIYTVDDYVNDYEAIYDGLKKKTSSSLIYNSSVYEYEPWSGGNIYDYMYMIIVLVGIAGITYQLSVYSTGRKRVYEILRGLGADRLKLISFAFMESVVIIICSSLAGLIFSIITGRVVTFIIEGITGIVFFTIDKSVYIGLAVMLVISIAVCLAVSIVSQGTSRVAKRSKAANICAKPGRSAHNTDVKHIINRHNYIRQTGSRLMRSQGIIQNISIRVFSLAIMVIVITCVVNGITVYGKYRTVSEKTDTLAFYKQDKNTPYVVNIAYNFRRYWDEHDDSVLNSPDINEVRKNVKLKYSLVYNNMTYDQYRDYMSSNLNGTMPNLKCNNYLLDYNLKRADASMYKGIDKSVINYISSINGVSNIRYGYYETARMWTWDDMDYNNLGVSWYEKAGNNKSLSMKKYSDEEDKYLFATEYVGENSGIYDILEDYAGDDWNYAAFLEGDEAIIFLDKNPEGEYDDTITSGTNIGLMCYQTYPYEDGSSNLNMVYSSYYKAVYNYMKENDIQSQSDILRQEGIISVREEKEFKDRKRKYTYNVRYAPAAVTKAAKVIYVDDEIKSRLKEYIPEFGLYTMVASDKLGEKAVNTQNEVLKEYIGIDELPPEITLAMKYNQLNIKYGLNSVYNGTANAVAAYLRQADFSYNDYSADKEQVKKDTIEALVLYIFTAVAAVLMYISIILLVLNNRVSRFNNRMNILRNHGADNTIVRNIHMYQCIREAIWCVILMPVIVILEMLYLHRNIK